MEQPVTCLATTAYATCTVRVTIFSTGSKFRLVSNSTELHALTLAAHSHTLHFNNASDDSLPGSELGGTVPVTGDLIRPVTQFRAQKTIITSG